MNINQIMSSLEAKHPGESEYLQAVKEVLLSIEDIYNQHPEFEKASLIAVSYTHLTLPTKVKFKLTWVTACSLTMPLARIKEVSVSTLL